MAAALVAGIHQERQPDTRGAQAFLSAPAASARIRTLEANIDAQLLYRGNKGVSLTQAGETLLRHLFQKNGYDRALRVKVRGFDAMCRMVEAGVGIAVMPESAALRHALTMKIKLIALEMVRKM